MPEEIPTPPQTKATLGPEGLLSGLPDEFSGGGFSDGLPLPGPERSRAEVPPLVVQSQTPPQPDDILSRIESLEGRSKDQQEAINNLQATSGSLGHFWRSLVSKIR